MKHKKAFTLAEMMIVFIIVGIIGTIAVTTVKPWEKACKHAYSRIYNSLSIAVYNYMANSVSTSAFPDNSTNLCCSLLQYLNTAGENVEGRSQKPCNYTNGVFTLPANHVCSLADMSKEPISFTGLSKSPLRYKFIKLSNGSYLWIGADQNGKPFKSASGYKDSDNNDITFQYYMVFVDLNGAKGPNNAKWKDAKLLPDIVAFAVTDKYMVLPLGYPLVDTRYLSAHVVYPSDDDEEGETISDAMSFHEARVLAYGFKRGAQQIILASDLFTTDYEDIMGLSGEDAGRFFRVANPDSTAYFPNAINFPANVDTNLCYAVDTSGRQIKSAICDVKIYDYH